MTCEIPTNLSVVNIVDTQVENGAWRPANLQQISALSQITTLRVGGPLTGQYVETYSESDLITAVRAADQAGIPLLVLGGGSNLVVSDAPFAGVVVRDMRRGIVGGFEGDCAGVNITVVGGQPFDQLVATAVANQWAGLEALSGIPGTIGAGCVQNIGAYGYELATVFAKARTFDRLTGQIRTFTLSEMEFGYRTSVLKQTLSMSRTDHTWAPTPRYVVLDVTLALYDANLSLPIRYQQLAEALEVPVDSRCPIAQVRKAVLELRRSKGMILDSDVFDSYSAGSFFMNPVLDREQAANLRADVPKMPVYDTSQRSYATADPLVVPGLVKTSAAFLISRAGFKPGWPNYPGALEQIEGIDPQLAIPFENLVGEFPASLSTRHVLAITNRGKASAADICAIKDVLVAKVQTVFGVKLHPEPVFVGFRN